MVEHDCVRRSHVSGGRWRGRRAMMLSVSVTEHADETPSLWFLETEAAIHAGASPNDRVLRVVEQGEVIEATLLSNEGEWAQLVPCEAGRLLLGDSEANPDEPAFIRIRGGTSVSVFGGRTRSGELWFSRTMLASVIRCQPTPLLPRMPIGKIKKAAMMDGRKVEAAPPLRHFERSVGDETIRTLIDRGYAVVDDALPVALCRKLRAEMEALEAHGQMWNSHSYASDDMGAPHPNINETQLDYKEVRKYAPTFARMEHDPSLLDRLRGVPGLERLGSQHVRIQINAGHGGCYTMHTDSGTAAGKTGQTLCLTALIYLNEEWQPGDGGELRVFPYPYAAEVIAPVVGRLVLFEPRMVHDVLPNYRKRFCFTLWCAQKGITASRQIDHESLKELELATDLAVGGEHAQSWRRRAGFALPYDVRSLAHALRPLFLSEMRMVLVRIVHAADELDQISRSHAGEKRDEMIEGISGMHRRIRADNPSWLLELLRQLPDALLGQQPIAHRSDVVRLDEFRHLAHRAGPWWI